MFLINCSLKGSLELSGKQIALATKYEVTNSSTKQLQDHKVTSIK